MSIDISREVELVIREKEKQEKEGDGKKISSELVEAGRKLNYTLKDFQTDFDRFERKMAESGLDSELHNIKDKIKREIENILR
jgi:hypothetical protein